MGQLNIAYHDHEWGKPTYDNLTLFEMICLEGQQAALLVHLKNAKDIVIYFIISTLKKLHQ